MRAQVARVSFVAFALLLASIGTACTICRPSVDRNVYGPGSGIGSFGTTLAVLALPLVLMLGIVSLVGRAEKPPVRSEND